MNRKGQIAIYVIIALVLVGGIVTLYAFRDRLFAPSISAELRPVFDYYKLCIEDETRAAIDMAGSQGGHIYIENYVPGSEYAPFSSQLNFLGLPVPYWYYITNNGQLKENVPTKSQIQDDISRYIEEKLNAECNLDAFYEQGFSIELGEPSVETTINDGSVIVDVSSDMSVSKGEGSARMTSQNVEMISSFGKLYNTAMNIYNKQRTEAFIENYSVDVLRAYAPVDGVELGCSGKIWKTREVVDGLMSGLEANIAALKFKGDYYTPQTQEESYFVIDLPVEQQVNMIYSRTWPSKIEIFGADEELMIAEPVGTQQGLGVMGFCYAPYHFVYDVSFPVMVQVIDGQNIFQFPVVAIIDKNMPRQAVLSELPVEEAPEVDICQFDTKDVEVNVYDNQLNKIDANLSYSCFSQKCNLGETTDGTFVGKAPACFNGYVKARASGYSERTQLFSTNKESAIDIILDREYDVNLDLEVGGKALEGMAIVIFEGNDKTISTALPDAESIKLSEGLYNVTVYAYGNSSVVIPGSTKTQCQEIARAGLAGLFGATEEKCFDISIPETKIESALIGGGKSEIYILPSDLEDGRITLKVDSLGTPKSIEELQNNYEAFGTMGVALEI